MNPAGWSKKLSGYVVTVGVLVGLDLFGHRLSPAMVDQVVLLSQTYLGTQGLVDIAAFWKGAKKA